MTAESGSHEAVEAIERADHLCQEVKLRDECAKNIIMTGSQRSPLEAVCIVIESLLDSILVNNFSLVLLELSRKKGMRLLSYRPNTS